MNNPNAKYGQGGYGQGNYGSSPLAVLPIEYYLGLLASQYKNQPKLQAWMQVVCQLFVDVQVCLDSMLLAFDIDYAVGIQLDALGNNVGISRQLPFQPSNGVSPILIDDDYRVLIKATTAKNRWDGQSSSLQSIWNDLFPGGQIIILDQQNMTANILLKGVFSSVVKDLITRDFIVPRPQAVMYNYVFSQLPIFGFGQNSNFVAGFATGSWG